MFIPLMLKSEESRRPYVTWGLVAVNTAILAFVETQDAEWIFTRWGFKAIAPSPVEALTSMFLHVGWGHLAGNMLFLWIFGGGLEKTIGSLKFSAVYLLGGLSGVVFHAIFIPATATDIPAVGASAAISGVMGAVAIALPTARVNCIYFWIGSWAPKIYAVPSAILVVLWFCLQAFLAVFVGGTGVALWAHVGGFVAGTVTALLMYAVPRARERRRQRAFSSAVEAAFRDQSEPPVDGLEDATDDERLVCGMLRGDPQPGEGLPAASAYLNSRRAKWSGRDYVRAVDAFSQAGYLDAALAAAGECFDRHKQDRAEPELLAQTARMLRSKDDALADRFAEELIERHPKSMQAREWR